MGKGAGFRATLDKALKGFQPDVGHWVTVHGHALFIAPKGGDQPWAKGAEYQGRSKAKRDKSTFNPPDNSKNWREKIIKHWGEAPPPGWTDVRMNRDKTSDVVATGTTPAKKTGESWYTKKYAEAKASAAKGDWGRIGVLNREMPQLTARVNADMHNTPEAMTTRLILMTGMRVGGETQAKSRMIGGKRVKSDYNAQGATNMEMKSITVDGNHLHFDFTAKENIPLVYDVYDKVLADHYRQRKRLGKTTLFDHDASATTNYIKRISGDKYTAKDLRSWVASVLSHRVVQHLQKSGAPYPVPPKGTREDRLYYEDEVSKVVASQLGNAGKESLETYIHPKVWGKGSPRHESPKERAVANKAAKEAAKAAKKTPAKTKPKGKFYGGWGYEGQDWYYDKTGEPRKYPK